MKRDTDTLLPPPPPRPMVVGQPRLGLWVVCSPDRGKQYAALDCTHLVSGTVGRGTSASFQVEDSWLSREHFRLTPVNDAALGVGPWELQDLNTRNGTWLNGKQIASGVVHTGDVIRAGATVLVLAPGVVDDDDMGFAGRSVHASELRRLVMQVARSERPVHISGESGAGKEVLAEAIHRASQRKGPFLAVNSASLVHSLAESQLFGHRKGAFSGADKDSLGAFDVASGGTLLLDEIGELDIGLQAKLLRVVECGEVHRLGDPRPHPVDVRLITATHRNLQRQVQVGEFREDLYWRIAHTALAVPPLRERRMDIMPIVDKVLRAAGVPTLPDIALAQGRAAWQAAEVTERYLTYGWPGNVRELRDEVTRLAESMAFRNSNQASSPLPALEDALSERLLLLGSLAAAPHAAAGPVSVDAPTAPRRIAGGGLLAGRATAQFPQAAPAAPANQSPPSRSEIDRFESLLHDKDALLLVVRTEFGGNIRGFAERAGFVLGRQQDTVRRHVYRVLGGALATVRAKTE